MQLIKSSNYDINYLSKIIEIKEFYPHPNPEVTRLKCCKVDNYNIIVGIDSKPGLYIFFPVLSQINPDFLKWANLYNNKELNNDPEKKGLFDSNGRVTIKKLKPICLEGTDIINPSCISEGFLIEVEILNNYLIESFNRTLEFESGVEFDSVEDNGKVFWFSRKFVPAIKYREHSKGVRSRELKQTRKINILDNQFRFHYDTVLIKKTPNAIAPNDLISITSKIHGTSHISARVLCKDNFDPELRGLIWLYNHIYVDGLSLLGISRNYVDYAPVYNYIYASRKRILNENMNPGFYGCDVWSYAHKYLEPHLEKGMTIYAEIVGYVPTGGYIQKDYDYGCVKPTNDEYVPEVHFKVRPYRITLTNKDGNVHEFSALEVQQWCKTHNLIPVTQLYYGYAKDLYPDIPQDENWFDNFITRLSCEKAFYMEQLSPDCSNKVYHEGIVIKSEKMRSEAWKLKTFAFVNGEQANINEVNIEDEA